MDAESCACECIAEWQAGHDTHLIRDGVLTLLSVHRSMLICIIKPDI